MRLEVIKLNKNDVIVLEFKKPLKEEQYKMIRKNVDKLGVKFLLVEPDDVKMSILKNEGEENE